jgi:hypothetical protein
MKVDKNELITTKEKMMMGKSNGLSKSTIFFLLEITFKRQAFKMHKKSNSEGEKMGRLRSLGSWFIKGRVNTKM